MPAPLYRLRTGHTGENPKSRIFFSRFPTEQPSGTYYHDEKICQVYPSVFKLRHGDASHPGASGNAGRKVPETREFGNQADEKSGKECAGDAAKSPHSHYRKSDHREEQTHKRRD